MDYKYTIRGLWTVMKTTRIIIYKVPGPFRTTCQYWLSRLHIQQIWQITEETVDNFVAQIKLQAKKCGTRDNIEFEQRVIKTIIAGI